MELFEFNIPLETDESKETVETKVEEVESTETESQEIEQEQEQNDDTTESEEASNESATSEESDEILNTDPVVETYSILKDFLPLNEIEDPNEDKLRQELSTEVPQKLFMSFVESQADELQELLSYGVNLPQDGNINQKLGEYFNKYMKPQDKEFDLETPEGARQYLESSEEFNDPFLGDNEERDLVLDRLEDSGKLVERAKKYKTRVDNRLSKEKEQTRLQAERDNAKRKEEEIKYRNSLKTEIEKMPWDMNMKQRTIQNLSSKSISTKNTEIKKSPRAIVQLANIYQYFENGNFDKLFDILEGKDTSKKNKSKQKTIAKDSLSKKLNKNNKTTTKVKGFVPQLA